MREGDGQTARAEDKIALITLSVANVLRLFVRTSELPLQVWLGVESKQQRKRFFTAAVFSVVFFFFFKFQSLTVDHQLIMLNILLSALLDPDRRLRSFRRSERLASILVCSTFIA